MNGYRKNLALLVVVSLVLTLGAPQAFAGDDPEYSLSDNTVYKGEIQDLSGATDDDDGDPGDAGDGFNTVDTFDPFAGGSARLRSVETALEDLVIQLWTQLMLM